MYNKIYSFCKVKNLGSIHKNTNNPTPRVEYLINLLKSLNIKYELDEFPLEEEEENYDDEMFRFLKKFKIHKMPSKKGFNINLIGNSNKFVVAHHDIVNPNSDNANDNSCSVINAIALKKLNPSINVSLLDGEEVGGLGSQHLSNRINDGDFGSIEWVLNFELSGKGGESFFIGENKGKLSNKIISLFDCPTMHVPFNDSVIFRKNGIDSNVINPLPIINNPKHFGGMSPLRNNKGEYLDTSLLFNCHSPNDSLSSISTSDMKDFTEKVLLKIVN